MDYPQQLRVAYKKKTCNHAVTYNHASADDNLRFVCFLFRAGFFKYVNYKIESNCCSNKRKLLYINENYYYYRIWKQTFCLQKHQRCSIKKEVLKNFTKFTKKHLCRSLFLKTFIRSETAREMFSCEFCQFLTTPVLQNTCVFFY